MTEAAGRDAESIAAALVTEGCDLLIAIGGSGVGRRDAGIAALAQRGEIVAHGIALQPGRTSAIGRIGKIPVIVLPGAPDQALAFFAGGDPEQVLGRSVTIEYLARQRDAREQRLHQLTLAAQDAQQAAQAKVARLRQMVQTLAGQQQRVKRLLAQFHPESPVIGDSITPRMRGVRDEVDRRYGPFSAIGCYRAGSDGEHPLGRACDFMLSTGGVMPAASWIQKGYDIAAWAQANASRLGIMYIIYRQRIWDVRMASSGWVPMENRGSITANHYDHVHISVF